MGGAGDGKKLCKPLNYAQQRGYNQIHCHPPTKK
jgi:hypothetical protein